MTVREAPVYKQTYNPHSLISSLLSSPLSAGTLSASPATVTGRISFIRTDTARLLMLRGRSTE